MNKKVRYIFLLLFLIACFVTIILVIVTTSSKPEDNSMEDYGEVASVNVENEHNVLRVGYVSDLAPFSEKNADGDPSGLIIDKTREAFSYAGLKYQFIPINADGDIVKEIKEENLDFVAGIELGMKFSNLKYVQSAPCFHYGTVLVSKKKNIQLDEDSIISTDNFYKTNAEEYIKNELYFGSANIIYENNFEESLDEIRTGNADVAMMNIYTFTNLKKLPQYRNYYVRKILATDQTAAIVAVSERGILKIKSVNDGIKEMKENRLIHTKSMDTTLNTFVPTYSDYFIAYYKIGLVYILLLMLSIYIALRYRKKMKEAERATLKLNELFENAPVGYFKSKEGMYNEVVEATNEFYEIIGFTKEQFSKECSNLMENITYEPDQDMMKEAVEENKGRVRKKIYEYRLVTRDGSIKWINEIGKSLADKNGDIWVFASIINVNDIKEYKEKEKLVEEKLAKFLDITNLAYIEANVRTGEVYLSAAAQRLFPVSVDERDMAKAEVVQNIICMDDIDEYLRIREILMDGNGPQSVQVRVLTIGQGYRWYKCSFNAIQNKDGNPEYLIGYLSDANEDVVKLYELREKSRRDMSTNLLNKSTFQEALNDYLLKSDDNLALAIIDLDDFKNVNDVLGHRFGDEVLKKVAEKLNKVCRTTDIVGRIGGDEFAVMFINVGDGEFMKKKVKEFLNEFSYPIIIDGKEHMQSCSVGVGVYIRDGEKNKTFDEIYDDVDRIMYNVKKQGKAGAKVEYI